LLRKLSRSRLRPDRNNGKCKSSDSSNRKNSRTATATTKPPQPPQQHIRSNRKGKSHSMAIVHVAFKSSSQAPPAAAHAHYIARDGQYVERG